MSPDTLVNRLRDDAGCSQGTCLSCTKGFENHEYGCTEGEYCLDSVAVLKKTRKRLRKVSLEAAARITELESALKEARRDALEEAAKVAEDYNLDGPDKVWVINRQLSIAEAIRALALSNEGDGKI